MWLFDDATAAAAQPATPALPGKPGYYSDGNLVQGVARSTARAWHFNTMMMEIANVVTGSGLALSAADQTQLYEAIERLIAAAIANLQTNLGFTPIQQGGGPGQTADKLQAGWDGTQLLLAVAGQAVGAFALKSDLQTAITNLIGGAPGALETLKELADAINDDASYAATVTAALGLKAPSAGPSFTAGAGGVLPQTVSPQPGDNSQALVPSSWVNAAIAAALNAVAHKGNASSANGPWWDWDPVTGKTECWGVYSTAVTTEGPIQVNFPIVMGRCDWALAGANETTNTGDTTFPLDTKTTSSATFLAQDSQGGNAATAAGFFWKAGGYTQTAPVVNG